MDALRVEAMPWRQVGSAAAPLGLLSKSRKRSFAAPPPPQSRASHQRRFFGAAHRTARWTEQCVTRSHPPFTPGLVGRGCQRNPTRLCSRARLPAEQRAGFGDAELPTHSQQGGHEPRIPAKQRHQPQHEIGQPTGGHPGRVCAQVLAQQSGRVGHLEKVADGADRRGGPARRGPHAGGGRGCHVPGRQRPRGNGARRGGAGRRPLRRAGHPRQQRRAHPEQTPP